MRSGPAPPCSRSSCSCVSGSSRVVWLRVTPPRSGSKSRMSQCSRKQLAGAVRRALENLIEIEGAAGDARHGVERAQFGFAPQPVPGALPPPQAALPEVEAAQQRSQQQQGRRSPIAPCPRWRPAAARPSPRSCAMWIILPVRIPCDSLFLITWDIGNYPPEIFNMRAGQLSSYNGA